MFRRCSCRVRLFGRPGGQGSRAACPRRFRASLGFPPRFLVGPLGAFFRSAHARSCGARSRLTTRSSERPSALGFSFLLRPGPSLSLSPLGPATHMRNTSSLAAMMLALLCLILFGTLCVRSFIWSDTAVLPFSPTESVRFHNGFGVQAIQFLHEYNALDSVVVPGVDLSMAKPQHITSESWRYFPSPWMRFDFRWTSSDCLIEVPCWFTTILSLVGLAFALSSFRWSRARDSAVVSPTPSQSHEVRPPA